jgi:hypothetical protein
MRTKKMLDFQLDKKKLLMQASQWMQNSKYKIEHINLICVKQQKNSI